MSFKPSFTIEMIRDGEFWCAWMGGTANGYNWGYGCTVADALRALADDVESLGLRPDLPHIDEALLQQLGRMMND